MERLAKVTVGTVPVAGMEDGQTVLAGNLNRFGSEAGGGQTLSVAYGQKLAVVVSVAMGGFPRETCLTREGRTLLLTTFGSSTVMPDRKWISPR